MLYDLLEKKSKPFVLVLTKCDKVKNIDETYQNIIDNV